MPFDNNPNRKRDRSAYRKKATTNVDGADVKVKKQKIQQDSGIKSQQQSNQTTANVLDMNVAAAGGMIQQKTDQGATKQDITQVDVSIDNRARKEEQMARSVADNLQMSDKYTGAHGYIDFRQGFRRETNLSSSKATGTHGPLRGQAHIRVTARFDYQPDVCKDYKETGYCAYGDSCKFMHDRSDYKAGWQIERDWEEKQKAGAQADPDATAPAKTEDTLPFACQKCHKKWREVDGDPLVTLCKHYFCQSCALSGRGKKKQLCFVCGANTQGVFNTAFEVLAKLESESKGGGGGGEGKGEQGE